MAYANRRRSARSRSRYRSLNRRTPMWVRAISAAISHDATTGFGYRDILPSEFIDPGGVVGSTVMRTRIDHHIRAGAISSLYGTITVGVALMSRLEPELGRPYLDYNNFDWMYWRNLNLAQVWRATAAAPATETAIGIEVDVKSKRRIELPSQSLFYVWQYTGFASVPVSTSVVSSSVLLRK